jgi:hypothetical protein
LNGPLANWDGMSALTSQARALPVTTGWGAA